MVHLQIHFPHLIDQKPTQDTQSAFCISASPLTPWLSQLYWQLMIGAWSNLHKPWTEITGAIQGFAAIIDLERKYLVMTETWHQDDIRTRWHWTGDIGPCQPLHELLAPDASDDCAVICALDLSQWLKSDQHLHCASLSTWAEDAGRNYIP